jgi:hypothetical protein
VSAAELNLALLVFTDAGVPQDPTMATTAESAAISRFCMAVPRSVLEKIGHDRTLFRTCGIVSG